MIIIQRHVAYRHVHHRPAGMPSTSAAMASSSVLIGTVGYLDAGRKKGHINPQIAASWRCWTGGVKSKRNNSGCGSEIARKCNGGTWCAVAVCAACAATACTAPRTCAYRACASLLQHLLAHRRSANSVCSVTCNAGVLWVSVGNLICETKAVANGKKRHGETNASKRRIISGSFIALSVTLA